MPTDRVLIEIITAANMAGVTEAKAGMLGLNPAALIAGAALAGLVVAGKSAIDIAEKHATAESNLAQAMTVTKSNSKAYEDQIKTFMQTNRDYISNQSDVIDSFAVLIRSGLSQKEVTRAMNDALDLSVLKNISLTDAVALLDAAEHGRMKGLIDLGITTAKYTDAQGNLIASQHNVAQSMAEIDAKVEGGRKTLSPLKQAINDLSGSWQELALKVGPGLIGTATLVIKAVDQYGVPIVGGFVEVISQLEHKIPAALQDISDQHMKVSQLPGANKPRSDESVGLKKDDKPWWWWIFPLAQDTSGQPSVPGAGGTKTYIDPTTGMREIVDKQTGKLIEWETSDQAQRKMAGDKQLEMLDKIHQVLAGQAQTLNLTVNVDTEAATRKAAFILRHQMANN